METISAIILTFNSADVISDTIAATKRVADETFVVDSYSTDATVEIVKRLGATVIQRPFKSYSDQRNWAIENLPISGRWQLHLDADEILTPELVDEILALKSAWPSQVDGFFIPRLIRFLGRDLRHGGYYPVYHMRLFKKGHAKVEDRLYDQHFVLLGTGKRLRGAFIDDHRMSLAEWTVRHNRWSDLEALELTSPKISRKAQIDAKALGSPLERKRFSKGLYYRAPIFFRPFILFVYRYIISL